MFRLFIALISFALFAVSCKQENYDEIATLIANIEQNNIADKRLVYSKVNLEIEDGQASLCGATISEKVFQQLDSLAKDKKLAFEVELLPTSNFKENPWGIVILSVCNIRSDNRHSKELVTQALMGTPVKVYNKVDGWYLVQTPDLYFGWVNAAGITLKTNAELLQWKKLDKVLFKNQSGFAYAKPNVESKIETDLVLANLLSLTGEKNEFYEFILADGRKAFVRKEECIPLDVWKNKSLKAEDVLATAHRFSGIPYLWGGVSTKMIDCSGFVKLSYYLHGFLLQRDASQQANCGKFVNVGDNYKNLKAGDLLFFGKKADENHKERVTHAALYIGNQEFIHASGRVRVNSLDSSSDKYIGRYEKNFVVARRIIDEEGAEGIERVVDNSFYKEILGAQQ